MTNSLRFILGLRRLAKKWAVPTSETIISDFRAMDRDVPLKHSLLFPWQVIGVEQTFLQTPPGHDKSIAPKSETLRLISVRLRINDKHGIRKTPFPPLPVEIWLRITQRGVHAKCNR
jgi:hypothetical protein